MSGPPSADDVIAALRAEGSSERARQAARYFKTGPGEYGEGDVFLGVPVPAQRRVARAFDGLEPAELARLLDSALHEARLVALLVMVRRAEKRATPDATRAAMGALYLQKLDRVNNWDLVDSSAPQLLGALLPARDRSLLDRLARDPSRWSRRIAMIATLHFIRRGEAPEALRVAALLVDDADDLVQKAVGWMLREVGARVDVALLRAFLAQHAATMPRTALRYAIEKLAPEERTRWLGARQAARSEASEAPRRSTQKKTLRAVNRPSR